MRFVGFLFNFKICIVILTLFSVCAYGQSSDADALEISGQKNENIGSEYFTISEKTADFVPMDSFTPLAAADLMLADLFMNKKDQLKNLNLLNWVHHDATKPETPEKYQRVYHFGNWIKDPTKSTCLNTRSRVLARDSSAPVELKENNKCAVGTGSWNDPYTNTVFNDAANVQVDHFVPLKQAYIAGAWKWSYSRRCNYANFMGNKINLLVVSGIENMKKGSKAPDEYLPPNTSFACQYLENWLKVKAIWKLKLSKSEALAISDLVDGHQCDESKFMISKSELKKQRLLTDEIPEACLKEETQTN